MLQMQQHQDGLHRRLSVIGVPTYTIKPLVELMVKWESCSGIEWTISRLKSLKVDLIRDQSGLGNLTWIRKNRSGDIAGTIGSIFRWARKSEKNFARAVQAFMAYTFYIHSDLTESQKNKFLSGINPNQVDDGLSKGFHKSFTKTVQRTVQRRSVHRVPRPLVTYQGSPDKKAPGLLGSRSLPQTDRILDELHYLNTSGGMRLYAKYKRLYQPLLLGMKARREYLNSLTSRENASGTVRGGEIHFLQEPGGKLRSVASPFRIHQEVLRPLGLEIYDVVRSLPWDCTFDQSKAIPHIQSHLAKGGEVHSVDLSSATDHFPLSLQMTALRAVIQKEDWDHLELFQEISQGEWKSPLGVLHWTKGQPLGLFPSFGSFTLTHGLLLRHLAGHFSDQFFVVGDDVVILDAKLHQDYIAVLDRMGCPHSPDKSISSSILSEFAGKIITKDVVIPQLKWRKMSDDNFLDLCRLLGRQSRCLLSNRQKNVFDKVAHLCEPFGLNFSLPGDDLATMVHRTLNSFDPEETVLGSLMSLRKKLNQSVYTSTEVVDSNELSKLAATFDEKVKFAMKSTIFSSFDIACQMGIDGFSSLPRALEMDSRLPLSERAPSRVSTLDRYERILQ